MMAKRLGALIGGVVLLVAPRAQAATKFVQAEDAVVIDGVKETTASRQYTGSSYVNPANRVGSALEWTIEQPIASLRFRYANGNPKRDSTAMELRVNGELVTTVAFAPTGSWGSWQMATVNIKRPAGVYVIRLTSATSHGGPHIDRMDADDGGPGHTDWTYLMVESTMARFRAPADLGSWTYYRALFLRGVLALHQRTGDPRYLDYVRGWVDSHVDASGRIDTALEKLDNFMPGHLLLSLWQLTGAENYRIAAATIRRRFDTYPRLDTDRAFIHKAIETPHQIWADGVFMANPFLMRWGALFDESEYANSEAIDQLSLYAGHLQSRTSGLLYHGFDESGQAGWADPVTHLSPEFWCRAMGWFGMTVVDVLDMLPPDHPRRSELVAIVQRLLEGLVRYQDPATGRWYQVVDKGSVRGNWLETSCGSMHTYVLAKSIHNGYVPATYATARDKGFAGTLAKLSLGSDGLTNLSQISVGTAVGDLRYYLARTQATNDMHGLGAFILMYEQLTR